jgi:hypothetical protein
MAKRTRNNGWRSIERRLAEGRGLGRGAFYIPWLFIHDVASRGLATRVKHPLNGRTCHFLSKLETDWFYVFSIFPQLLDLREQYPLHGIQETIEISQRLNIKHPADPRTGECCIVTTDFLLTFKNGLQELDLAIAIKPSSDLSSSRVLEKLQIEKSYWDSRGVSWRILTEKQLSRAVVKNVRWLFSHLEFDGVSGAQISEIRGWMERAIDGDRKGLAVIASECDNSFGLRGGTSLSVCRHLIASKVWKVDLTVEIDPSKSLRLLREGENHDLGKIFN